MNIWLINHYAVPPKYYPLARTTNFAKYLIRKGYSVTIFAASSIHNSCINLITDRSKKRTETIDGISYVYVKTDTYEGNGKARIINMFQFARRLPAVCQDFPKPDVILASSATPMACMAGIKLAKIYKCKCIAEISDLWPESFVAYGLISSKNPLLKLMFAYEKKMYKKADKIIFTMAGGKDYIIEKGWDFEHGGPIKLNKIYHLNNGVDLEVFDHNKKAFIANDEDIEDENTFKVVYVGAIRSVNKVDKVFEVAKLLKNYNIKFLLWGRGDQFDFLRQRATDMFLHNVIFKGYVEKHYIPYIVSKAQLNILFGDHLPIYRFGVSPNKLFDYFASGKPTLLTFKTGYSLIEKYKCGIEIDGFDAKQIAAGILYFKNMNENIYNKYCENARQAAEDFDFKRLTSMLSEIIQMQEI